MKRKFLHVIPVILCMVFIFYMSHQPATVSGKMSTKAGVEIGKILEPEFENFTTAKKISYAEHIDFWVRKTAHICEYVLLGCLMAHAFIIFQKDRRRFGTRTWLLYGWGACVIYAITDEVHQLFISGRGCGVRDMCIDGVGAFLGIVFYVCVIERVWKLVLRKNNKISDETE